MPKLNLSIFFSGKLLSSSKLLMLVTLGKLLTPYSGKLLTPYSGKLLTPTPVSYLPPTPTTVEHPPLLGI